MLKRDLHCWKTNWTHMHSGTWQILDFGHQVESLQQTWYPFRQGVQHSSTALEERRHRLARALTLKHSNTKWGSMFTKVPTAIFKSVFRAMEMHRWLTKFASEIKSNINSESKPSWAGLLLGTVTKLGTEVWWPSFYILHSKSDLLFTCVMLFH